MKTIAPKMPVALTAFVSEHPDATVWCYTTRDNGSDQGLAEAMYAAGFRARDIVLIVKVGEKPNVA